MPFINKQPNSLSEVQNLYYAFWQEFNNLASSHQGYIEEFAVHRYPSIRGYEDLCFGHFFHIVVKLNVRQNEIQVGVYFDDTNAYLRYVERYKSKIETLIPYPIEWKLWETKASAYIKRNVNEIKDKSNWQEAIFWMLDNAVLMKRTFLSFE